REAVDPARPPRAVEGGAEAPDREHVDDVPVPWNAGGRSIGMVGEAVRLHLLEVAAASAAHLLPALVEAEPAAQDAQWAHHLRRGADGGQLADEDLRAARSRRAQRRQAAGDHAAVDGRRLGAGADKEGV